MRQAFAQTWGSIAARGRKLPATAYARLFFVLALSCGLAAGSACNERKISEEQANQGMGLPDSSSTTRKITLGQRCELDELVVDPAEGTPEWAIWKVLEAAAGDTDDDASFAAFYAHFDRGSQKEDWVRKQFWPRARTNVTKYLQRDKGEGVTFKVCRRLPNGDDEVKIFIQSLDEKKSNPPMTLKKDDTGAWKITFFTP